MKNIKQTIILLFTIISIIQIAHCASVKTDHAEELALVKEFFWAVSSNDIEEVKKCLSQNVNVNAANSIGATALICATTFGYTDIVKILLEYKSDDSKSFVNVNAVNGQGQTALIVATFRNCTEIVRLLVDSNRLEGQEQLEISLLAAKNRGYHNIVDIIQPLFEWQDEGHTKGA